jgi:hypothetical protein
MKNYDELAAIIEEINQKIKDIDKQMITVEDIKIHFGAMDTFIPELEAAYKEFDESLSNSIFRTQTLNKIVSDEAINEYYDIYQELNSKCTDIMNELLESVQIVETPIEVLDITPISSKVVEVDIKEIDPIYGKPIINQEFIDRQVSLIKPIDKGMIDPGVIPLPTPVQPEIEILEM